MNDDSGNILFLKIFIKNVFFKVLFFEPFNLKDSTLRAGKLFAPIILTWYWLLMHINQQSVNINFVAVFSVFGYSSGWKKILWTTIGSWKICDLLQETVVACFFL